MTAGLSQSLAVDPTARVAVFVDGQNLYKACRRLFGHPLCHPHLLAQHLAGPRTVHPPSCRFYTGRPNLNVPGQRTAARNLDRRLATIQQAGVAVITRPLRYHWDWGHQEQLPRPTPDAGPQTVTLRPWQRPQEKGIDVALALDVVELSLTSAFDVGIVVSLDRDLQEIPLALHRLRSFLAHPVRLEAAVPVGDQAQPKILPRFAYTHQITSAVFGSIRDDTDYTVDETEWELPVPPRRIDRSAP